jgi:hypothetical protein
MVETAANLTSDVRFIVFLDARAHARD